MQPDDAWRPGSIQFLRRLFGPLLALLGSATTIAAMLLGFGFLAQSGLFGFAGLPRLASDPQNLIEAGAAAVVESVPLALMGTRLLVAGLGLLIACLLVWLRETRSLRRLYRSPIAFFVCQLAALALAFSVLTALIDTAQKGSASGREIVRKAAEKAREDEREWMEETRSWTFEHEEEAAWAATWKLSKPWPLAGFLNELADQKAVATTDGRKEWASSLVGRPLRLSPRSREAARELYGWLALATLLLIPVTGIVSAWRRAIPESPASWSESRWSSGLGHRSGPKVSTGRLRRLRKWFDSLVRLTSTPLRWIAGSPLGSLLVAAKFFVEPLVLASCAACVVLLPMSYGILAEGSIGREEVQVILRQTNWKTGKSCLNSESENAAEEKQGTRSEQFQVQGMSSPGPEQEEVSSLSRYDRRCSSSAMDSVKESIRDYEGALQRFLVRHSNDEAADDAFESVRKAIDTLLGKVANLRCIGVYRQVWEFRPHPALMTAAPRVAEYFWDRWLEVQDQGSVRFGYILSYPRGESGYLTLLETLADPVPPEPGRWDLRIIPMSCVENTLVLEDPRARHIEEDLNRVKLSIRDPSDKDFEGIRLHPGVLDTVTLLIREEAMPHKIKGALTTRTGMLLRAFSSHEPVQSDALLSRLVQVASDPSAARDHRRAAVTAIRMSGDGQAAAALLKVVDGLRESEGTEAVEMEEVLDDLPEIVTQAGFLLAELERHGMSPSSSVALHAARRLEEILRTAILSDSSMLAGAACSVVPVASQGLEEHVASAIQSGLDRPDRALIIPCINALGSAARTEDSRSLLWAVVANRQLRDDFRFVALSALYSRGIQTDSELLTRHSRNQRGWGVVPVVEWL